MRTTPLSALDIPLSKVAFGTAPLGQLFGPVPRETGIAAVHAAREAGITLFDTSPYYGDAEERLGIALAGHRDEVLVSTKAGRFPGEEFDFSPARIRRSLENSLRLLRTDHVDLFFLHDIDFVDVGPVIAEAVPTLQSLKEEGKTRAIGISGYGLGAAARIINETCVDVVLTFAHGTLLDNTLHEVLGDQARERGVGLINAAAVALGALTPAVMMRPDSSFMAPGPVLTAARSMARECQIRSADLAFLANQYAIQRSQTLATVIGTTSIPHLLSAVAAATTPIDEDLLRAVLSHRPDPAAQWKVGLPENRSHV
ncbi:MAG: aldo/keto reductase [Propioniciclava sp.]